MYCLCVSSSFGIVHELVDTQKECLALVAVRGVSHAVPCNGSGRTAKGATMIDCQLFNIGRITADGSINTFHIWIKRLSSRINKFSRLVSKDLEICVC